MNRTKKFFYFFLPFLYLLKDSQYRKLILFAIFVLLSGTLFYHWAEGWGWIDSLYFCVISLTTVGYGDFSPQKNISKIFTIFYLLGGISILLGFINAIAAHQHLMDKSADKKNE